MAWVLSGTVASGPTDAALPLDGSGRPIPPTGSTPTIDGINWNNTSVLVSGGGVLNAGTRVLLLNQGGSPGVAAASNGVWNFQGQGNHMTRPTNANDYVTGATLDSETVVRVSQGSTRAHTEWSCVTSGTVTVDTTAIAHSPQKTVFNVRDFGAIGTGGGNDAPAIQAALNAATPGSTVYFPGLGSVYNITGPLNIPISSIRLLGESSPETGGTTISASFGTAPTGSAATIPSAPTNNAGNSDGNVLVTISGLTGLSHVNPGDLITVSGSANEVNNTTSTIISVNAAGGSVVYYGYPNLAHTSFSSTPNVPVGPDSGPLTWTITPRAMFYSYGNGGVTFENLSLLGNGSVGAIVDASTSGSGGVPSGGCTAHQFIRCRLDGAVFGVKIGDFSGYVLGGV